MSGGAQRKADSDSGAAALPGRQVSIDERRRLEPMPEEARTRVLRREHHGCCKTGGDGKEDGIVAIFVRLLALTDDAVTEIVAIVMGETLEVGSAAVEAVGVEIGVDMARYWQADDAFFGCLRDKTVLGQLVAEVAGEGVAAANAKEPGKVLKAIVRDHLQGTNGRAKVSGWVPRWMRFPPAAYTARGGVGSVEKAALVAAANADTDTPPDDGGAALVPPEANTGADLARLAA